MASSQGDVRLVFPGMRRTQLPKLPLPPRPDTGRPTSYLVRLRVWPEPQPLSQNVTEHNPAPSPSGHPLLSCPMIIYLSSELSPDLSYLILSVPRPETTFSRYSPREITVTTPPPPRGVRALTPCRAGTCGSGREPRRASTAGSCSSTRSSRPRTKRSTVRRNG